MNDLRYAIRVLHKNPGFAAGAIVCLALGIGGNTAIFSVFDAVLLRPLPYRDPDALVSLSERRLREQDAIARVAPADFLDWRAESRSFTGLAATTANAVNLTGAGEPERLIAVSVTAGLLETLGVAPIYGRAFSSEEEQPGQAGVAILTHGLWQRRFGADPLVIGRTIALDGTPRTVVGVLPVSFWLPQEVDLLVPLEMTPARRQVRTLHYLSVFGRLKPGMTFEQAQAEMDALAGRLALAHDENEGHGVSVMPLHQRAVREAKPALLVLLGAVGLVLLIACVNVANLLIARMVTRQREIAIRAAIGASRAQILRQLIIESLVLACLAGALGCLLAGWGVEFLRANVPQGMRGAPGLGTVGIDARVLAMTAALSIGTGLLFGLLPAFYGSRGDLRQALHGSARGPASEVRSRLRYVLVSAEIGLALVLLAGAGLLLGSFARLVRVPAGFGTAGLVAMDLSLPSAKYSTHSRVVDFHETLLERLRGLPGVTMAGASTALPFGGEDTRLSFEIDGRTPASGVPQRAHPRHVSPDYLRTLGVPLLRGRHFTAADTIGTPLVVIINTETARRYFANDDPIGRRISFSFEGPEWLEIVGVTGNMKHTRLEEEDRPEAYLPYLQGIFWEQSRTMTVVARASQGVEQALVQSLPGLVRAIDPDQPVSRPGTMEELIAGSLSSRRLNLVLLGAFASLALLLAAAGIYGVMAYAVNQRRQEIGIRMALGAAPRAILRQVLVEGLSVTLVGVAIGLIGAVAATPVLRATLYGVTATDPATFAAVTALLILVALAACYAPARRAMQVDPVVAMRAE